ncbi:patatin-like phospholipase family protein [Lolliginicoccus suaedae]|uniref:patatin-like phospholipase family protein n=1 Tax=Lolliginicoccus suaedae TaxID=2605429 RepID=UPI0011ED366C|nr:patatin-like phospholipase family protein [Lolliginicoccus suaedae]
MTPAPSRHPVLELLDRRRAGHRDNHRLALAIEGGGPRGAYSAGMLTALDAHRCLPSFDALYGSSAGAFNAAWALADQAGLGAAAYSDPAVIPHLWRPRNILGPGAIVDTHHLARTVYTRIIPLDYQRVLDNAARFHPIATDADTGLAVDLRPCITDIASLQRALAATANLVLLGAPPIPIDGHRYVDAGVAEPIPYRTAIAHGATHILVLRTTPASTTPSGIPAHQRAFMRAWLGRRAPGALPAWLDRYEQETADNDILHQHSTTPDLSPHILEVRPPDGAERVIRHPKHLGGYREAVHLGAVAMHDMLGV